MSKSVSRSQEESANSHRTNTGRPEEAESRGSQTQKDPHLLASCAPEHALGEKDPERMNSGHCWGEAQILSSVSPEDQMP